MLAQEFRQVVSSLCDVDPKIEMLRIHPPDVQGR